LKGIAKMKTLSESDFMIKGHATTTGVTEMKLNKHSLSRWQGAGLALVAAATLSACGGGGSTVTAVPQSISSLSLSAAEVAGGTANLSAQASSGLTSFTYTSSTPSICTVSNAVLTFVAAGTCTVSVTQAGNANFSAASTSFNFAVSAAAPAQPSQQSITFSSGFASNTATVEGGAYTGYSGSNLDGWGCNSANNCGGGSGGYGTPATSYAYYYYQTTTAAAGEYVGISLFAPGVTALSTSGDTSGVAPPSTYKLNFKFNPNPEWYSSNTKNFVVILALGKKIAVTGNPNCHIQLRQVVTPTSAGATTYSLPLSGFGVVQDCGTGVSTVSAALTASPNVSQIDFQGDGGTAAVTTNNLTSGANLTVATTGNSPVYPTTIALTGGITFTP
jgi:hypothetical protein